MEEMRVFLDLGVVLLASFFMAAIFEKLKLPPVIGMIIAGILLNPFTPGFVVESKNEIALFAQLGGILLMFVLGLQFDYTCFRRFGAKAFVVAGGASIATLIAGAAAGSILGFTLPESLIIGAFFVSTSTTIALRLQKELGLDKLQGSPIMEAAIVIDDLYGFIALALVSAYIGVGGNIAPDAVLSATGMVVVPVLVFIAGVRLIPPIFELIEQRFASSGLTVGTVFCLMLAYALSSFGISPFISAFLAGTILTSSIRYRNVLRDVMPIRNLFANVFFVSVGLMLNPGLTLDALPAIIALVTIAIASKWIAASLMLIKSGIPSMSSVQLGLLTAPRGEVLLILAESVVIAGVVSPVFLSYATGIVLLSALAVPFLAPFVVRRRNSFSTN